MSVLRRLQLSWKIIRLIFQADQRRALLSLTPISPVAAGASYVAARNLLSALPSGERSQVVWATALFAAAFLGAAWLGRIARTARLQVGEATTFEFQVRRAGAVLAPDGVEHLDDPDYLDRLETLRARSFDVNQAPRMFGWMIDSIGGLVVSIALLVSVHPMLALVILGGIPAAMFNGREQTKIREARTREAERVRRAQHLYDLATKPETAAEIRMADVGDELVDRYATEWRTADRSQYRAELRAGLINAAGWFAQALAFAIAVAGLVDTIREGTVSPADLFLALGAMSLVVGQVSQAVGGVTSLSQILWLFDDLEDLEDLATRKEPAYAGAQASAPDRLNHGISLRNVSFSYQAAAGHVEALENINLDIAAGDIVAIVGNNGAGKSTLVKLLFGLYQPDTGSITVDGTALTDIDLRSWRARCSACFQDHLQLELQVRESIGAGSLDHLDNAPHIADAVEAAGTTAVIDRLPNGFDTQLGVRFGGQDLSGGEWQRVALSRSMMREKPLIVALDEPSASLDPLTEHQLFQTYASRAQELGQECGAITVLVSHRFSTVSMAGRIVVLDGGRIIETGTHDELIAADGTYAGMYELQARHYR